MMTIKDLVKLMWRNVIYIAIGIVLGTSIGFFISKYQTPVYEASTKIFVSRTRQQNNTDILSLSDEQLLAINLQLAKSQPVLNEVASQLGKTIDADNIFVEAIPNSLIIQIKVQENDSNRAAAIANLLAQTLIKQNQKLLGGFYDGFETAIIDQIGTAQKQIENLEDQISQIKNTDTQDQLIQVNQQIAQMKSDIAGIEKQIASYPQVLSSVEVITIAEKRAQLDQLLTLMTLYQQIQTNLTYTGKPGQNNSSLENPLVSNLQSTLDIYQQINNTLIHERDNVRLARAQSMQNVTQIVPATSPKKPTLPIPVLNILLGGSVGAILVIIALLILDQLKNPFKSIDQVEDLLGLPVLGSVIDIKHNFGSLVTVNDPHSSVADGYHRLWVNQEIIFAEKFIHSLLIVDAEPAFSMTSIAANLAVINVQQGKTVILVDGNLKKPFLHKLFGLDNRKGLAELLDESIETVAAFHKIKEVTGLTLIPSGFQQKNTNGLLDMKKLGQLLSILEKYADLVIVNSPPPSSANALAWGSQMDAVLMTIRSEHTSIDSGQSSLKSFQLIGAKMAGTVYYRTSQFQRLHFHITIKPIKQLFKRIGNKIKLPTFSLSWLSSSFPQIIANFRTRYKKHRHSD